MIELAIAITGVLLSILIPLTRYVYRRKKKLKAYYVTMWEKSSKLKPRKVLGIRGGPGFNEYYYKRPVDDIIKTKIEDDQNVLIVGGPLSGKSRAILQALTTLSKNHDVIIPKPVDIDPDDFHIPFHFTFWRKTILLLDGLDRFAEKRNFTHLLQEFLERDTLIVASCRSGPEYEKLRNKMEMRLNSIFGDVIEIPEIPWEEAKKVADHVGREMPTSYDGNLGSIFLKLDTMKERFQLCSTTEKGILRSIKRLKRAGIDRGPHGEKNVYTMEKIRRVCTAMEEIDMKHFEWVELLRKLEEKGFLEMVENGVRVDSAYLFLVEASFSTFKNYHDMIKLFSNDFETLALIGIEAAEMGVYLVNALEPGILKKAQDIERVRDAIPKNSHVVVAAFEEALRHISPEHTLYPTIQFNVGVAYAVLARTEPENKVENCMKAIKAYKEFLKTKAKGVPENDYSIPSGKVNLRDILKLCENEMQKQPPKKKTSYIS